MAHAPFSPGDHVEFAGGRLGQVFDGPCPQGSRGLCYLVQSLEVGGGPSGWIREDGLELADMREWVQDTPSQGYRPRPPVRHLAAKAAAPRQPLLCCGKEPASLPGRDMVTRDPAKVGCEGRALAARYYCAYQNSPGTHSAGAGTPTRKTCAGCKGVLIIERGLWGVFRWNADGRYPWEDAICTYTRAGLAEERATSDEAKQDAPEHGGWVARWIPLGS